MKCVVCKGEQKNPKNKTCGRECATVLARQTRGANERINDFRWREQTYGKANPWTEWEKEQLRKDGLV